MTIDLRPPKFSDQVIVLNDATMGFEFAARLQWKDEMFVPQANQLGKVAVAGNGGVKIEGHKVILPYHLDLQVEAARDVISYFSTTVIVIN